MEDGRKSNDKKTEYLLTELHGCKVEVALYHGVIILATRH
jgi:hypothetical protein